MKAIGTCRVCGKKYEYCYTIRPASVFRWQDVACCQEHGAIYLAQIHRSRGVMTAEDRVLLDSYEGKEEDASCPDGVCVNAVFCFDDEDDADWEFEEEDEEDF